MGRNNNVRISEIGENMVVVKLMQNGWDAFNVNQIFNNYKSIDIVCVNPDDGRMQLVQVKTGTGKNAFPTGFISDNKGNIKDFEIRGPWVFVVYSGKGVDMSFKFYVLSKSEVEELIRTSNNWYMNEYVRDNEISNQTPVGIKLKHLMGEGEEDTMHTTHKKKHAAYINPLGHNAENRWDKIWE